MSVILAGLAAGAAVGFPLVTGQWTGNWPTAVVLVIAAVRAAQLWFKAAFNPFWGRSSR